jgi:hypothetical protein
MDTRLSSERTENRVLTTTLIQNSCLSRDKGTDRMNNFFRKDTGVAILSTEKKRKHAQPVRRFPSQHVIQREYDGVNL